MSEYSWRPMRADDVDGVVAVAASAFPDHFEARACFAERVALFPQGCFALASDDDVKGYLIAYPWPLGAIPPLDSLLGTLPDPQALRAFKASGASARVTRLALEQCPRLDGIHVLAALGSRGITLAHSCGRWLQQHLDQHPMELPEDLRRAMDPARFAWRQLRKQTVRSPEPAGH